MSSFLKIKIPSEWEIKKLKDCATINPENLNINDINEDFINYVDIASIDSSTFQIKEVKRIPISDIPSRARRVIKENDVIISTVRPYLKAFSKVNMEHDNFICSTGFAVLRAKEGLNYEYLFQWILNQKFVNYMISQMVGSSYPAVKMSDVETAPIIIPPLNEQIRISSILSNVDEIIIYSQKIINQLNLLKKGLMQRLFTEGIGHTEFKETILGKIPKEWEVIRLKETINLSSGKVRPKDFRLERLNEYLYPIYGGNGILGFSKQCLIDFDTIIIGRVGEYCGAIHFSNGKSWISDNAMYIKEFLRTDINKKYLTNILKILDLNKYKKRSGQPLISQSIIYSQFIPIPPFDEQRKIVAILNNVDNIIEKENVYHEGLKNVKKGLMQNLLTGKKRVKIN